MDDYVHVSPAQRRFLLRTEGAAATDHRDSGKAGLSVLVAAFKDHSVCERNARKLHAKWGQVFSNLHLGQIAGARTHQIRLHGDQLPTAIFCQVMVALA